MKNSFSQVRSLHPWLAQPLPHKVHSLHPALRTSCHWLQSWQQLAWPLLQAPKYVTVGPCMRARLFRPIRQIARE